MKKKQRPYILIDGPSPFDCLETWERFLAEVQEMPDSSPSKSKSGAQVDDRVDQVGKKRGARREAALFSVPRRHGDQPAG